MRLCPAQQRGYDPNAVILDPAFRPAQAPAAPTGGAPKLSDAEAKELAELRKRYPKPGQ